MQKYREQPAKSSDVFDCPGATKIHIGSRQKNTSPNGLIEDHSIVGWAVDINCSGAINPLKPPGSTGWSSMPRVRHHRLLKMDEPRRTVHSYALLSWAKNGKQVKATNDDIDFMVASAS